MIMIRSLLLLLSLCLLVVRLAFGRVLRFLRSGKEPLGDEALDLLQGSGGELKPAFCRVEWSRGFRV